MSDDMHLWPNLHRQNVPVGSAIATAIDYSLKRLAALKCCLDDAMLNWGESRIRLIEMGRSNWHFAGSQWAGPDGGRDELDPVCLTH